uniref:Uncharacterized protein n=1 Tax=Arundo donax TaxID=35708 RepID=A0A0A9AQM9_ARUDO
MKSFFWVNKYIVQIPGILSLCLNVVLFLIFCYWLSCSRVNILQ